MMKKRLLIGALCLCLLASLCVLTSCNQGIVTSVYPNAEKYRVGAFEYDKAEVKSITLDWFCGDVNIVVSEADVLSVSETGAHLPQDEQMHHWLKEDGTLFVRFGASGLRANLDEDDKQLTLQVPSGIDLNIVTTTADVHFGQLSAAHLLIKTHSGDVEVGSLVAKSLDVTTLNGDVEINSLVTEENAAIATTSGDISVRAVSAKNISASSISGEMELGQTVVRDKMKLSAVSGNMFVSSFSGARVELETVSGRMHTELATFSSANMKSVSGEVYVKLPEDKGSTVYFETTSGTMETEREYITALNNGYRFGVGEMVVRVETVSGALRID